MFFWEAFRPFLKGRNMSINKKDDEARALIAAKEGLPLTIPQSCFLENMSQTTFYASVKEGKGPATYLLPGTKSALRISHAAHLKWRADAEQTARIRPPS